MDDNAFAFVGESVELPHKYYQNNIVATLSLLEAMRSVGVDRIVFSSTTATYGEPETIPITESERQEPINPYGFSKLVAAVQEDEIDKLMVLGRLRDAARPAMLKLQQFIAELNESARSA